jgi:1-acyl-sn-glycerol-3-phosphate acyltransferase
MNEATPFYRFAQWLMSTLWRGYGSLHVRGREHVPATGPFLLICNHQSNLDPMLIQSVAPRPVHAMAKSTQFAVPVVGQIMRHLWSFPVRRHQVDPLAVRLALRYLHEGYGVCIYVEGERSWDGQLQKPRRGTLRLALKAGVPVIPCVITGSYEAWPRWDRRIRRHHVRITFGPPIPLPHLDRRIDRDAFLDEAADRIMGTLRRMIDEAAAHPAGPDRGRRRGRDIRPG